MERNAVLVIGSGAREHAIAAGLRASAKVGEIYCAPGNAGMARVGSPADVSIDDAAAVLRFIDEKKIALTVIGPEAPLVAGLSDALRAKGHLVVGASKAAAQLEGSKIFAKTFMVKYGLPTAAFRVFDNAADAKTFARSDEGRAFRVLKADGLAAGKGVVVAGSVDELLQAIDEMLQERKFGDAGAKILLEETLEGPEVSVIALTDGHTLLPFPPSQDHKRAFDDDRGPNTGGMGAYAPTPFYDDIARFKVETDIIQNFVLGLKSEGLDFRGIIYFGIMLTASGPKVLEFNVRLGDPEAEAILPLVQSDLYDAFRAVASGTLSTVRLQLNPGFACTVVVASGGYPGSFQTGFPISGLEKADRPGKIQIFHGGTKREGGDVVTNGGRVLAVTGLGKSLESAVVRAYQGVKRVSFKNAHFRKDIAAKVLQSKHIAQRIQRMKARKDAALAKA